MRTEHLALVLLVEDNPADANLVEEALTAAQVPCGLHVLSDGTKAMEFIAQVENNTAPCPDLVPLDLNLPRIGGEQILRKLRDSPRLEANKVLIVTSSSAASDRRRAMELSATDYFRKPSTLEQFLELGPKVRQMLE